MEHNNNKSRSAYAFIGGRVHFRLNVEGLRSNGIYMATHNYIYNLLPSYLKTVTFHTLLILLNKLHATLTIGTVK